MSLPKNSRKPKLEEDGQLFNSSSPSWLTLWFKEAWVGSFVSDAEMRGFKVIRSKKSDPFGSKKWSVLFSFPWAGTGCYQTGARGEPNLTRPGPESLSEHVENLCEDITLRYPERNGRRIASWHGCFRSGFPTEVYQGRADADPDPARCSLSHSFSVRTCTAFGPY